MPRRPKCRLVCQTPHHSEFFAETPANAGEQVVIMTVEEYETIRLIDHLELTQEECAQQMGVARTTVQRIYNDARKKLARFVIEGGRLRIDGGSYTICDKGRECLCKGQPCCRPDQTYQKEFIGGENMIIAATYEDGQIFQHFGHTQTFKIYDVQDKQVKDSRLLSAGASGHGALAGLLQTQGVQALICGGIGAGARTALDQAGIQLYAGVSGDADAQVEALLRGELQYVNDATCSHHDHEHEHGASCGNHSCGNH